MKEITLPIKCSTLKDVYEEITIIMVAMIVITSFVITVSWWEVLYYVQPSNVGIMVVFTSAAMVCLLVVMVLMSIVYDNLPAITCIKDEETK